MFVLAGVGVCAMAELCEGFHSAQKHSCCSQILFAAQQIWEAYVEAMKAGFEGAITVK